MQMAWEHFGITAIRSLQKLPSQSRGTGLVLVPAVPLSAADLDTLSRYVDGGGVLIVIDSIGLANPLLARLGLSARINGQGLLDPLFNVKNRHLPKITDIAGPPAAGVSSLVFNHASIISHPAGMTVQAQSSPIS
jgi:hypothetical protein